MTTDPPDTRSVQLDLYKLAVEMADRVSARRALANTFFLTLNTGLVTLLGSKSFRWYVPVAGVVFAGAWWALLQSYRRLNWAKFEVINQIEQQLLPLAIYSEEWEHLQSTSSPRVAWPPKAVWAWARGYKELGTVERVVPLVFVAIYIAELIRQVVA